MGRKRYTPEQIINMLLEAEVLHNQGFKINEICRKLGISVQTFCCGRKKYRGMRVDQAKRLKELEREYLFRPLRLLLQFIPRLQNADLGKHL
jgi:DNA-binding transcriptional MerR regulator